MDNLGNTKVFVIPKKNATLNGSQKWKNTMRDFVENRTPYMEQYHQRQGLYLIVESEVRIRDPHKFNHHHSQIITHRFNHHLDVLVFAHYVSSYGPLEFVIEFDS